MAALSSVEGFLAGGRLALVGASRAGRKFGNTALRELSSRGYEMLPVHPEVESIDGFRCWPSLAALPGPVDGVVIVVPPDATEGVVREASAAGIPRVWMQHGASSAAAIRHCEDHGISVVHDECILMFAEPVASIHRVHRWLWKLLGKLPQ